MLMIRTVNIRNSKLAFLDQFENVFSFFVTNSIFLFWDTAPFHLELHSNGEGPTSSVSYLKKIWRLTTRLRIKTLEEKKNSFFSDSNPQPSNMRAALMSCLPYRLALSWKIPFASTVLLNWAVLVAQVVEHRTTD